MTERTPYEVASLVYLNHLNDCPVCDEDPTRYQSEYGRATFGGLFCYCTYGRQFRDEVVRTELLMNLSKAAL